MFVRAQPEKLEKIHSKPLSFRICENSIVVIRCIHICIE